MTTKRAPRLCADCGVRPASADVTASGIPDMCQPCYDYAGAENYHSDSGHDRFPEDREMLQDWQREAVESGDLDRCPVCHPELDPRNASVHKGHSKGIAKSHSSHAGCKHAATKAARAACRKARA